MNRFLDIADELEREKKKWRKFFRKNSANAEPLSLSYSKSGRRRKPKKKEFNVLFSIKDINGRPVGPGTVDFVLQKDGRENEVHQNMAYASHGGMSGLDSVQTKVKLIDNQDPGLIHINYHPSIVTDTGEIIGQSVLDPYFQGGRSFKIQPGSSTLAFDVQIKLLDTETFEATSKEEAYQKTIEKWKEKGSGGLDFWVIEVGGGVDSEETEEAGSTKGSSVKRTYKVKVPSRALEVKQIT